MNDSKKKRIGKREMNEKENERGNWKETTGKNKNRIIDKMKEKNEWRKDGGKELKERMNVRRKRMFEVKRKKKRI